MNRPFQISLRIARALFIALWTAIAPVSIARADYVANEFDRANRLYDKGNYAEAITAYEKLIAEGKISPAIYFNRGNAFFKLNQIGRAIESYRHAESITPRDPDVRANLQFARNQVAGSASLTPSVWKKWLNRLTLNEWTRLAMAAFWILILLLALVQWRTDWKRFLRKPIIAFAAIFFALGIILGLSFADYRAKKIAIVLGRDAVVRTGPLEESQSAFRPDDGAELAVLDSKDDWLQVTDGKRIGWLKRNAVVIFAPSLVAKS